MSVMSKTLLNTYFSFPHNISIVPFINIYPPAKKTLVWAKKKHHFSLTSVEESVMGLALVPYAALYTFHNLALG